MWPRFCASSSRAKVESPLMLIRWIGSICTAIFRLMDLPFRRPGSLRKTNR